MIRASSIHNSIFITYLVWVFFIAVNFMVTMFTSDVSEKHGIETFYSMYTMLAIMLIVLHSIGATLAWYVQKGSNVAKWLFILFCLSFAVDSLFGILQITELYKHTANYNPFKKSLLIIVWCALAVMAWVKSSNKSLNPIGANNAPPG